MIRPFIRFNALSERFERDMTSKMSSSSSSNFSAFSGEKPLPIALTTSATLNTLSASSHSTKTSPSSLFTCMRQDVLLSIYDFTEPSLPISTPTRSSGIFKCCVGIFHYLLIASPLQHIKKTQNPYTTNHSPQHKSQRPSGAHDTLIYIFIVNIKPEFIEK